jgi:hypothetical protein
MVLAAPSIATAASSKRCTASACKQYLPTVPGAGGNIQPSNGKKKTYLSKTSAANLNQLKNAAAKRTLGDIATKSKFGAPIETLTEVKNLPARSLQSSVGSSLTATMFSSGAGSKARLLVLLSAIVAISAGIGVAAVRRQRS